jgi:hypothetical protein
VDVDAQCPRIAHHQDGVAQLLQQRDPRHPRCELFTRHHEVRAEAVDA